MYLTRNAGSWPSMKLGAIENWAANFEKFSRHWDSVGSVACETGAIRGMVAFAVISEPECEAASFDK